MFISKKHLPRRTVLRGLGSTIALPLLDAMIPAATALAQTAAYPLNLNPLAAAINRGTASQRIRKETTLWLKKFCNLCSFSANQLHNLKNNCRV